MLDFNALLKEIPARTIGGTGSTSIEIPAGKILKLQSSPNGEEFGSGTVPIGKRWAVKVIVSIEEFDA